MTNERRGSLYALGAYTLWGFFPVYWKFISEFPSIEILAHRLLWSFVFYWIILTWLRGSPTSWLKLFRDRRLRLVVLAASVLITCNWLLYIWAVNNGHILESSLGYFITPLLNVLMGSVILKERLSALKWTAVGLAAMGVLVLALQSDQLPFIALGLAFSFSTYGLIRKRIDADVFETSTAETAIMLLPALALAVAFRAGTLPSPPAQFNDWLFFIGSGFVTGLPLVWFAYAARLLPLSSLGFFQYIAPTIQFGLGAFVFHEPLTSAKLYAFGFIWAALAVFSYSQLRQK